MADWWLQTGTTSTAPNAESPFMSDVSGQISATELASCAVTTAKVAATSITSEKASTNLLTRSYSATLPDPAQGITLGSTGFVVWKPSVPVRISALQLVPLGAWSATTCGAQLVVWGSCQGVLATVTASSTTFSTGPGEPMTVSLNSTAVGIGAGERICAALLSLNACDNAPGHLVQFDYTTTA